MTQAAQVVQCPGCGGEVSLDSRFCRSCGRAVDPASLTPTVPTFFPTGGAGGQRSERYAPGQLVAERYRITSLLGRGGMGEVYRADDLKLGQAVALKFLTGDLAEDDGVRGRFLNEVRVARQVTHPNVCRVHDIGEVDGRLYLSMEFVDGENLASLLRRIGHLPKHKAVEIARQLCAGLAAAHERGLIHRDLKPANVMLDGRGQVRITDFGVAGLVDEIAEGDLRSGTPAYMAPEQLAGREVSTRSDIYSLGLVLYETLTGKPAFEAGTIAELKSMQKTSTPARPSSHVDDMDPMVERVILRCLEADPAERPESALAVAAALPGGDPLAAALAAGETPSPEMVAAAGVEGSLRPAVASGLLVALLAAVAVFIPLMQRTGLVSQVALDKPQQVLRDRAREILAGAGQSADPTDWADGFYLDTDYLAHLESEDDPTDASVWDKLGSDRRTPLLYWYRQSPRSLVAVRNPNQRVSLGDPPPLISGMASVEVDPGGRLVEFNAVPPQRLDVEDGAGTAPPAGEPGWERFFTHAGLDLAAFAPTDSVWLPLSYADRRYAWIGADPQDSEQEVRVEAASFQGRPVFFRAIGPWSRPERMERSERAAANKTQFVILILLILLVLSGGLFTARRNLRAGRGDRRGAFRMAVFVFLTHMISWLLIGSHTSIVPLQWYLFIRASGLALFLAGLAWILYLALEPYVRRWHADRIIAWSRLIAGRLRDPLVGRDVLLGALLGVLLALSPVVSVFAGRLFGIGEASPLECSVRPLEGARAGLGLLVTTVSSAVFAAMFIMFLWVMARGLLRLGWLADVALVAFMVFNVSAISEFAFPYIVGAVVNALILLLLVKRFGLLALAVALAVSDLLLVFPVPRSPGDWYAPASALVLAVVTLTAFAAFQVSLGGRALIRRI